MVLGKIQSLASVGLLEAGFQAGRRVALSFRPLERLAGSDQTQSGYLLMNTKSSELGP